ncbi:MAG: hypothetical protein AAF514_14660, partial [Verrucomicrobiota bacterium]
MKHPSGRNRYCRASIDLKFLSILCLPAVAFAGWWATQQLTVTQWKERLGGIGRAVPEAGWSGKGDGRSSPSLPISQKESAVSDDEDGDGIPDERTVAGAREGKGSGRSPGALAAASAPPQGNVARVSALAISEDPDIHEEDWLMVRILYLPQPGAVEYNPADRSLYVASRMKQKGGIFRFAEGEIDGFRVDPVETVAGLAAADGTLFYTNELTDQVVRMEVILEGEDPVGVSKPWVHSFEKGDHTLAGIAVLPPDHQSSIGGGGLGLVSGRGRSGQPGRVHSWSTDNGGGPSTVIESPVQGHWVDLAADRNRIFVVEGLGGESLGAVYELTDGMKPVLSEDAMPLNPTSVVIDPNTGDLILAARGESSVLRLTERGELSVLLAGFKDLHWDCLTLSPDGRRLFVSDLGAGRVYEFEYFPPLAEAQLFVPEADYLPTLTHTTPLQYTSHQWQNGWHPGFADPFHDVDLACDLAWDYYDPWVPIAQPWFGPAVVHHGFVHVPGLHRGRRPVGRFPFHHPNRFHVGHPFGGKKGRPGGHRRPGQLKPGRPGGENPDVRPDRPGMGDGRDRGGESRRDRIRDHKRNEVKEQQRLIALRQKLTRERRRLREEERPGGGAGDRLAANPVGVPSPVVRAVPVVGGVVADSRRSSSAKGRATSSGFINQGRIAPRETNGTQTPPVRRMAPGGAGFSLNKATKAAEEARRVEEARQLALAEKRQRAQEEKRRQEAGARQALLA